MKKLKKIKPVIAWGVYEDRRFQHLATRPKRKLFWLVKRKRNKLDKRKNDWHKIEIIRVKIIPVNF